VREVDKATQQVLKAGFILPYDAEQIGQSANASNVFLESGGKLNTDRQVEGDIEIQELMRTGASWNGTAYGAYPEGVAEPVVAKITIPARKELTWHSHPMPSFAYVLSGEITVEDDKGNKKHFTAGEVMPETVQMAHHGIVVISPQPSSSSTPERKGCRSRSRLSRTTNKTKESRLYAFTTCSYGHFSS
jgi:quercetin dioxygenase-like cupin family protein